PRGYGPDRGSGSTRLVGATPGAAALLPGRLEAQAQGAVGGDAAVDVEPGGGGGGADPGGADGLDERRHQPPGQERAIVLAAHEDEGAAGGPQAEVTGGPEGADGEADVDRLAGALEVAGEHEAAGELG